MDEAHTDMIADPSAFGDNGCNNCHGDDFARSACDACHTDVVTATSNSLHTTQNGYIEAINARCPGGDCGMDIEGSAGFQARCAGCHTTCGQCHISRPQSVGGGFPKIGRYYAHRFSGTPDMSEQCTACHGSRIGHDYNGDADGNERSAHRDAGMRCEACHTADEIHGDGNLYTNRYEMPLMPRCEDCHGTQGTVGDAVSIDFSDFDGCTSCHVNGVGSDPVEVPAQQLNHAHHVEGAADCSHCHDPVPASTPPNAQCQVCHSQPYKNCTNCHNLMEGHEAYDIDPSTLQLKIARISRPFDGIYAPYGVSLVRHVPVDPGTYANWPLTLGDFASVPTWKYTSPHNVLASTPQTQVPDGESCTYSCHGTAEAPSEYLLRAADLEEAGTGDVQANIDANIDIVIPVEEFPLVR